MDCASLENDLCAYVDNELELHERLRVETHVCACPECADVVESYRGLKALVGRMRLYEEDAPVSIVVVPEQEQAAPPHRLWSWLRQPIRARSVALAAAAVGLCLFVSWQQYSARYTRNTQRQYAVLAHLQGIASVLPETPSPAMSVALRPVDDHVYAHPGGPASLGALNTYQTVYFMGRHAISQLRIAAGDFDDSDFERINVAGREYRVGQFGDHAIATYRRGPTQIVLVSDASPEVLVALAQNIPPDTPFSPGEIGY